MYVIVIDIGTTNTKGALVDADGRLVTVASRYAGARCVDGHIIQDPDEVIAAAISVIQECLGGTNPVEVANVVIGGNQSALVWVDAEHRAVSVIDSWLDTQYYPNMTRIAAELRDGRVDLSGIDPTTLDNFVHLAKVDWWLAEHPDVVRRAIRWTIPGCFVAGTIAGRSGADAYIDITSMAYSGLADLESARWLDSLCGAVGIPTQFLPDALPATTVVGSVTPTIAGQTGLLAGTPVLAGCGDFPSAALGAGTDFNDGIMVDIGGTASLLAAAVPTLNPDHEDVLRVSPSARPGEWYLFAYVPGGRAIEWFDASFGLSKGGTSPAALEERAAAVSIGSDGLVFVPHLGGRMSPPNQFMRGSWDRIQWDHDAAHFYRSILEAVAFEYVGYVDRLKELTADFPGWRASELRVVGSAARNQLWNQMKADCLGLDVYASEDVEAGLRGLAIVAAVGAGVWDDWKQAARAMVAPYRRVAQPRDENRGAYEAATRRYRATVAAHVRAEPGEPTTADRPGHGQPSP